jgi:hypothetical protein
MALTGNPLNVRRRAVGMTIETTSGTAETPTAVLANTLVLEATCEPTGVFDGGESRPIGQHGGAGPRTKVMEKGKLTMKTRMRHADATLSLLQLCGFVISGTDSEIATSVWADLSQRETGTFYFWEDGRLKRLHGANGSCKIKPATGAGGPIDIEWEFEGIFTMMTDAAMPSDPTLTTTAYRNAGLTLTLATAQIPQVSDWELDVGSEFAVREDVTAGTGLHRVQVEDGSPMLTLDPEARLVANYDAYGKFMAGTKEAAQIVLTDGTNTMTVAMPQTQRIDMTGGERSKKITDGAQFEIQKNASGVDLTFTESVPA